MSNDKINHAVYSGKLSEKETIAKFTKDHKAWRELQAKDSERIMVAIEEVFASAPEATLNKPAVCTMVLSKIGFTPETHKELLSRVEAAFNSNDRFYTIKGKGGGAKRLNDEQYAIFKSSGKLPTELARDAKAAEKAASKK